MRNSGFFVKVLGSSVWAELSHSQTRPCGDVFFLLVGFCFALFAVVGSRHAEHLSNRDCVVFSGNCFDIAAVDMASAAAISLFFSLFFCFVDIASTRDYCGA